MWYLIVSIPDLCTLTYFETDYRLIQVKKYYRMQEHSAILSKFIKLPFIIKILVLSIFELPHKTDFTLDAIFCLIIFILVLATLITVKNVKKLSLVNFRPIQLNLS